MPPRQIKGRRKTEAYWNQGGQIVSRRRRYRRTKRTRQISGHSGGTSSEATLRRKKKKVQKPGRKNLRYASPKPAALTAPEVPPALVAVL
ncbi:MAG: hypothetical protein RL150_364 [Candidatus Parcubacteria bacterium]|jgi:hypothetical protein